MGIITEIREFVTRKRRWYWLAAAIALAIVGHLLEGIAVISTLQHITNSIETSLRSVQPFEVATTFRRAALNHSGLWFCAPVGSSLDAPDHCGGLLSIANASFAYLVALPEASWITWGRGGLVPRAVMLLTALLIVTAVVVAIRSLFKPGERAEALRTLVMVPIMAPPFVGVVLWIMLQVLLVLTFFFGQVLAGIAWLVATFAVAYKFVMLCLGIVQSADSLQDKAKLFSPAISPPPPTDPPAPPMR